MRKYYRVMLGGKSALAGECYNGNFIGAGFYREEDLKQYLTDDWREFNKVLIPKYLIKHPEKNKMAAGQACGSLWTISKGINIGDVVLCPNGPNACYIGEITSDYYFDKDSIIPHKRNVKWFDIIINKSDMSESLSTHAWLIGTVHDISKLGDELESFIRNDKKPRLTINDETIENPESFALEKHLEEFLIKNWNQTEFGKDYSIWENDGELAGQQYETDTGPIDILAISKDKKTILVVELKKGRASDNVVGQIQRYMGFVKEELAEREQAVKGAIIALDDDKRIRRALAVTQNIDFYRYRINFQLIKV